MFLVLVDLAVQFASNWARRICGAGNKLVRCLCFDGLLFPELIEAKLQRFYIMIANIRVSSLKILKEEKNNAKPNET